MPICLQAHWKGLRFPNISSLNGLFSIIEKSHHRRIAHSGSPETVGNSKHFQCAWRQNGHWLFLNSLCLNWSYDANQFCHTSLVRCHGIVAVAIVVTTLLKHAIIVSVIAYLDLFLYCYLQSHFPFSKQLLLENVTEKQEPGSGRKKPRSSQFLTFFGVKRKSNCMGKSQTP